MMIDDHHSVDDLYEHRNLLFLALMAIRPDDSWISKRHYEGDACEDGWFIAGMETPYGDVSYHMPERLWDLAVLTGAAVLDQGRWWDGHMADDVLSRLCDWIANG